LAPVGAADFSHRGKEPEMKIAAATGALLAGLASGLCGCGEPSPEPYIEQLKSTHSDEREEAAYDLLRLGAAVVPRLLEEVDSPSSQVRYIVVQLLGRLRDQRAVPFLVAALGDRSAAVAGKAAWSLAELRVPEALPALLEMAGHGTTERRRHALRALGFCHSYDWEPVLSAAAFEKVFAAMGDTAPQVRIAALEGIRQFGYRRAAAEVVRMSRDPSPEVRYVAVQALGQIAAGVAPRAEALAPKRRGEVIAALVAALDEDQYQSIRTESIRALASSGDSGVVAHLERARREGTKEDGIEVKWALRRLLEAEEASGL
jgi:HEAT repeat protein